MNERRKRKGPKAVLGTLFTGVVGVVAGWIGYSQLLVDHQRPLPPALEARQERWRDNVAGEVNYYVDDGAGGRPLLFVHSVNAAASAYEVRPLFEHYRGERTVFALDLPGFGFSDRVNRVYSPDLYAGTIVRFLNEVIGEPADVIALSLGTEFAARAALADPANVASLAFISPTGLSGRAVTAPADEPRPQAPPALLTFPLWSQPLYDLLVTRPSLEYFLKMSFAGPVNEGLLDYSYATSHQPGARHAPLAFISGRLFTRDARDRLYAPLTRPTVALYNRSGFVGFDGLPALVAEQPLWQAVEIAGALDLPHWEQLAQTTAALDGFWEEVSTP